MTDSEKYDLILSKLEKLEDVPSKLEKLEGVPSKLDTIEKDVKDIKFTLDNEIRVNIQRIAEGHLDLSRKLQEAMKPNAEVEMLSIKVRTLESDVRALKRAVHI